MALDDDAPITAATGYILRNVVDTAKPTEQQIYDLDVDTLPPGWTLIGHTSREDLPEIGFEGGTTETRGSWQNASLKTITTEIPVDYVDFNLIEMDGEGLALYYGVNGYTPGTDLDVDTPGEETQMAFLLVLVDGENKVALHCRKVGVRRNGPIGLSVDNFATLPLRATKLKSGGNPLFSWIFGEDTP